jgi:hypothetical protein
VFFFKSGSTARITSEVYFCMPLIGDYVYDKNDKLYFSFFIAPADTKKGQALDVLLSQ